MKLFKTTKITTGDMPEWYYGKVYEVYDRNKVVWSIVGLHAILKTFRYIRQLWNMYRKKKTWFDKQWLDAYELGVKSGYFERVKEENKSKYFVEEIRKKLKLPNKPIGIRNEAIN